MASSFQVQVGFKYDVFLSFRGEDTRKNFVDHLFHALQNRCITTYKDDVRIEKGGRISDQLIISIQESRFHIIVFSKNYASSSWCLDELVKIMECHKTMENTAYPVFYHVTPTEIRNQTGLVGTAFAKLVEKEAAGRWREAMQGAAGLAGWELKNTVDGHEAKFIQLIVQDISAKLQLVNTSIDGKLVGMETRVKNVVSSLNIGSEDVYIIGIKGIGGGGKTTLARAVYDHISIFFEAKSFVENVREVSKGSLSGLKKLQKLVLKDVLNDKSIEVTSVSEGKYMMKKMMQSRKVLVVLDDVDDVDQLEALAGELTWFKRGSRIIITTRDEQVLVAHRVNFIHDINLLSDEEAMCLFSKHAFGRDIPIQKYEELSGKVIHYAAGLPLTIKVLGSHLCGRTQHEWVDAIERLKTIPLEKTLNRLEISYSSLENDEKEIFLDVVCMLKGATKNRAIQLLESCGFNAQIGLRVLVQKSLITISDTNRLRFHDHIEEMGWNIVRSLHPYDPNRHNRLWIQEEIDDILANELGTEDTKCIKLEFSLLLPAIIMNGLRNMRELRFLYVDATSRMWIDDELCPYLPDALRSLFWRGYPLCYLPKTFRANKLVNLEMPSSYISQLWEGVERKVLGKLKFINLSSSKLRSFDLGMTPNLEKLDLANCNDFVELHMANVCPKLTLLDLSGSKVSNLNLRMIPTLEKLNLRSCSDLVELHLPVGCPKLTFLNISGSKVSKLNLGMTPHLKELFFDGCKDFVELHMAIECPQLRILYLARSKVSRLNLGLTPHLEKLNLGDCRHLQEVNAPMACLKSLKFLNLNGSLRFESFWVEKRYDKIVLGATLELSAFSLVTCLLHPNNDLPKFRFKCIYHESYTSRSENIAKLISFGLCACTNLESFSASICSLQDLRELTLKGSSIPEVLTDLWQLKSLEKLTLMMKEIKHLPDTICFLKRLKFISLNNSLLLEQLPNIFEGLECIEELHLEYCVSLQDIPNNICKMKCLKILNLLYCIKVDKLPEELGNIKCLKELNIEGSGISHLPQSILERKDLCIIGCSDVAKNFFQVVRIVLKSL